MDKIDDPEGSSQEVKFESSQLRIGQYKLKPDEHFVEQEMPFKGMFWLSYSLAWVFEFRIQRHFGG